MRSNEIGSLSSFVRDGQAQNLVGRRHAAELHEGRAGRRELRRRPDDSSTCSSTPGSTTTTRCPRSSSTSSRRRPDYFLGVGSGDARGADGARDRAARAGAARDAAGPGARPRRRQLDARRARSSRRSSASPSAHVEAGLRSFDRTMPEEINRVVADAISRRCSSSTRPRRVENLLAEGVDESAIHYVGNTMIDTLVAHARSGSRRSTRRGRARARARRVSRRHAAPPGARRRRALAGAGRRALDDDRRRAAGRLPGASAHARARSKSSGSRLGERAR